MGSSKHNRMSRQKRQLLLFAVVCVGSCVIFLALLWPSAPVLIQRAQHNHQRYQPLPNIVVLHADSGNRKSAQQGSSKWQQKTQCRVPKLDINGSDVIAFFKPADPLSCHNNEPNWVYVDSQRAFRIYHNITQLHGVISCTITYLHRVDDNRLRKDHSASIKQGDVVSSDYAEVQCEGGDGTVWKGLLWTVVPDTRRMNELSDIPKAKDWSGLDVYFIGYDSMSQMAFRRQLPLTVQFIEDVLQGVVLDGYNIVGDGTPQAFIPILTGSTEEELPLTRKRFPDAHFVDDVYPFIWQNFSQAGYITLYAEDAARIGTFTYRLKGFKQQPTDHYVRTFYQRAEQMYKSMLCQGSTPMHQEWFRYMSEFMLRYNATTPKFLLAFHAALSHDSVNQVQVADEDTARHLQHLYDAGAFDNAVVIVMADHGHRFAQFRGTHQGQLEERLPFFSVALPKKLRQTKAGQLAYNNLKNNKDRLTTPFDIHATLLDVLHWPDEEALQREQPVQRSMSLFRPLPSHRSCAQAGVAPHWCTCLNWESAMDNEQQRNISDMLAQVLVQSFNDFTLPVRNLCAPLTLLKVESSKRLVPHADLLRYKNVKDQDGFVPDLGGDTQATFAHYQLNIITSPGNALYEATVEYDQRVNKVTVDMTAVSHVNKYGDAPHCVIDSNYFMAAYCVCYDKI